jgi:hypothetical protein
MKAFEVRCSSSGTVPSERGRDGEFRLVVEAPEDVA